MLSINVIIDICSFCYWFQIQFPYGQRTCFPKRIPSNLLKLVLRSDLISNNKTKVPLLLGGVFTQCQLGEAVQQCFSSLLYIYWFSTYSVSYWKKGVEISDYTSTSSCSFYPFLFQKFETLATYHECLRWWCPYDDVILFNTKLPYSY